MRKIAHIITFGVLAVLLACTKQMPAPVAEGITITAYDADGFSKNTISQANEERVAELELYIYDEDLNFLSYESTNTNGGDALSLILDPGVYHVYALANSTRLDRDSAPAKLTNIAAFNNLMLYDLDQVGNLIPMAGYRQITVSNSGGNSFVIPVTRLFSRIELKADWSALSGCSYRIKSVSLSQCCGSVQPFWPSPTYSPTNQGFDFTASLNLTTLNNGSPVYVYVPENRQGTCMILSHWDKSPDYLNTVLGSKTQRAGNLIADNATYINILTSFDRPSKGIEDAEVLFRFYLGANSTMDFNLVRNNTYQVTFKPTLESAYKQDNWKVVSSLVDDNLDIGDSNEVDIDIDYGIIRARIWNVKVNGASVGTYATSLALHYKEALRNNTNYVLSDEELATLVYDLENSTKFVLPGKFKDDAEADLVLTRWIGRVRALDTNTLTFNYTLL